MLAPAQSTGPGSTAGRYRARMAKSAPPTITNRKARYDYAIDDRYECGIVLEGAEVKSIREGRADLRDSYARVDDGEVWLHEMHITPYSYARPDDLEPRRKRKLLLHRGEIEELARRTAEAGVTLVPLRCYFKDGRVKVEIAVARGKRRYDKRQAIREREDKREAERALKRRSR